MRSKQAMPERQKPNLKRLDQMAEGFKTPDGKKWNKNRKGYATAARLTKMLRKFGIEAATDDEMGWTRCGEQTGVHVHIRVEGKSLKLDKDIVISFVDQINHL